MRLALHIGAHKTASTYLQLRLRNMAPALAAAGVAYVPPAEFRQGVGAAGGLSRGARRLAPLARARLRRCVGGLMADAERQGCTRLVLSDENMLGSLPLLTDRRFFPRAARRLAPLVSRAAAAGGGAEIFLCVRSYASFFVSVWSHRVINRGWVEFDARVRGDCLAMRRGWADVVGEIRRWHPRAALTVWCHDDFGRVEEEVVSRLTGQDAAALGGQPIGHAMPGLSAMGVRRVRRLVAEGEPPTPDRIRAIAKAYARSKGYAAWSPWTAGEGEVLRQRFEADIAAIQARGDVDLIR